MLRHLLVLIVSVRLVSSIALAQADSASSQVDRTQTIHSTSREVLLDLIVRDKHHHLVSDLRPEEIEVYEDTVPQKVLDFHGVEGAAQLQSERTVAARSTQISPATGVTALPQTNFVAIAFGDIGPLNLEFARQAVLSFLKSDNLPNTYVSLYRVGRTLGIARLYTDDKQLLTKSVDDIAKGLHTDDGLGTPATVVAGAYSSLQAIAANLLSSPQTNQVTQTAVRNALLNPLPIVARDPLLAREATSLDASYTLGNAILAQARVENGIRFASNLSEGMNTFDSLHEIVRSQELLPGRKVVIYLSDGLTLPMNRRDAIDNLISYANRAGVAFYAVDTRGLNIEDPMIKSLGEMERTGAVSSAQRSDPVSGHKEDDDIQLTAVSNRQLALRELAESTGGFAVTDTNEIAVPMERVMEDIRSHYELAYSPSNMNYDGRFRKIQVKVRRPHVTVQTRTGYFALPDLNGHSLQPFEAVALNAINSGSRADGPLYHLAVMRFRPRQNAVEHLVAFEIPVSGLHVSNASKAKQGHIRVSLFAVVRDGGGNVIGKIGRELTEPVPDSSIASANPNKNIYYAEPIELAPGHYRIDAAITDEESGQVSVKRLAFFVAPAKDFGLSSLQLVEEHTGATGDSSVTQGQTAPLVPTLAESVVPGKPVDLYFVLYPQQAKSTEAPKVVLTVLHDGKESVRKPMQLPQPAADGSVPIRLRLSPEPGQCDIIVVAQQGKLLAETSLSIKVE